MVNPLIAELVTEFEPRYALNDPAHRIDHVLDVTHRALDMNRKLDLGLVEDVLIIPGMLHDLFNVERKTHHELAAHYIQNEDHHILNRYSWGGRFLMAQAAAEHRASRKERHFTSIYSEVIASADRGVPDAGLTLKRAMQYAAHHNQLDIESEEVYAISAAHLKEKFGRNGYITYPSVYTRYHEDALELYWLEIENL